MVRQNGRKKLEICVDSLQSALIAQQGGADRIELCSALELGGLTPDPALFLLAKQRLDIPIFVLIRPRMGGFVYDDKDQEVIVKSIQYFKENGVDGIVLGALTNQGSVDLPLMQQLMNIASPLPVTFHRAFDQIADPISELPKLVALGIQRILTSGQKEKAVSGISLLKEMVDVVGDKITILAGGGVSSHNIDELLSIGLNEMHASARISVPEIRGDNNVLISQGGISDTYRFADLQEIATLRKIMDKYDTINP